MVREKFAEVVTQYVTPHGQPPRRDGRVHLIIYREVHPLLLGETIEGPNADHRQVAVFGVIGMDGDIWYHVLETDLQPQGGLKITSIPAENIVSDGRGDKFDISPNGTLFLPAPDNLSSALYDNKPIRPVFTREEVEYPNQPTIARPLGILAAREEIAV